MSKATVLKLDGKPLNLNPEPAGVRRIREFLDTLPADQLRSGEELSREVKLSVNSIRSSHTYGLLPEYRFVVRGKRIWGNPRAIAELKRQLGVQG